jgi:hypothetical protein
MKSKRPGGTAMTTLRQQLLASAFFCALTLPATAGTGTITTKDASGTTHTFDVVTDGSGNFGSVTAICDGSALATCANVSVAGTPGTNALTVQPITLGNGTSAAAARVTLSNDSTGQVTLASGAAVTANAGTNLNTSALATAVNITGSQVAIGGASNPTNATVVACSFNSSVPTLTSGQSSGLQCNSSGELIVGNTNPNGPAAPSASSPVTLPTSNNNFVLEPTASDNHQTIVNGSGHVVQGLHVYNNSATVNYGRLYNAGTGFNGCNSATGLVYEFQIPASTAVGGIGIAIPQGLDVFSNGISICVTSTYGQTSTANATPSAISFNLLYR